LKAKTPEEKAEAQRALEEAKKKLIETQKLQETAQQPKQETKEEPKIQPKETPQPAPASATPATPEKQPEAEKPAETLPAPPPSPSTPMESAQTIKQGDFVDYINLDVKPNIVVDAKPDYPPLARQNKVEGRVYVKVNIDENGAVTSAEVLRSPDPDYGVKEASIAAAKKTKFSPAMKNGVRVKTSYTLNYLFTLKK
ncbi:MAG: TonB family protein, partial [Acidobacteria bacterium]|nr:TonB family protein [Acidobacteriota bacterium]